MCFKITDQGNVRMDKILKEWTNSKIAQYRSFMNKWNWFAVLKAYEKLKSIASDPIDFNTSLFAIILERINELSINKVLQKSHTKKLI